MDFANRDKELFGFRAKGIVKFIIMSEFCKIFALGDLCDDIGEDDVIEKNIPGERHTVEAASSSILFLGAKFINSRRNCGVEVLYGESGVLKRGADSFPQIRISHKV
jgi:hypothetical protein